MKVKIKRAELFDRFRKFQKLNNLSGLKFVYSVMRVKTAIEREIKAVQEIGAPKPDFLEYEKKRTKLIEEYCKKNKDGKPVLENGSYIFDTDEKRKEYEEALLPIKKEHQESVNARIAQQEEVNKFLETEVELEFYDIKKENVPEGITVEQLEIIAPFVTGLDD